MRGTRRPRRVRSEKRGEDAASSLGATTFCNELLILRALLAGAFAFLLGACQSASTTPRPSSSPGFVSLERSGDGRAAGPLFVVTLFEDGHVLFEGRSSVKAKGAHSKRIPAEQAAAVFARLEVINFWDREPRYDLQREGSGGDSRIVKRASTEVPWETLIARRHGRFKRIDGLFFAPRELTDFAELIRQTVGLADWVGTPAEWKN